MGSVAMYQDVDGRVFGNENPGSSEDRYVRRLLHKIRNGVLVEEKKAAIFELQSVVSGSCAGQMAFGAMGFQVILSILKEEHGDVHMVREALETLIMALMPLNHAKGPANEVQPNLMNSDLLCSKEDNIAILLSLLSQEDFHVRYDTLQLMMPPLTNSPQKLREAICSIPGAIRRLMDLLKACAVIRKKALSLLTFLNCEAGEIQKISVTEGDFEKIFCIIEDEGGSEGGVVVQECLVLLNNLLRNNASNQALLRDMMGIDQLLSVLKLRETTYKFSHEMTINVLSVLEIINLLIMGGPETYPSRDTNKQNNKRVLVQVLDHLLMLGVESQWAPAPVRCVALHCIGDLIMDHPENLEELASKRLGEEPDLEPALDSVLRMLLRTSCKQEYMAADYLFKNFCQQNPDGQTMLVSTLILQPESMIHAPVDKDSNRSFGSMLLYGLTTGENKGDLETCSRAAIVLSHIINRNNQCKEKVLHIELEDPTEIFGIPEPLLHRMVKYLALASSMKSKDGKSSTSENVFVQLIFLKLLIIWLSDCPKAVQCFLDSHPHLTYLLKLVSNPTATVSVRGLAAVLLGECLIYNKSNASGKDAYSIFDAISQKVGLTSYFLKFDEMQRDSLFTSAKPFMPHRPLTRSSAASMAEIEDGGIGSSDQKNEHPMLKSVFDSPFIYFLKRLEADIREKVVEAFYCTKSQVTVVPAELEQRIGENGVDYIKRLQAFVEKQCHEIQSGGIETLKAEAMEEGEAEFNDLLECLGQEQSKVDKLSTRLRELGEDVDKLLEDTWDDAVPDANVVMLMNVSDLAFFTPLQN